MVTRLLGSVLALWLALVVGEPGILDPCPVHGNLALLMGATPEQEAHSAHAGMSHDAPTPAHDHEGCSCLGCCTGPVVTAVLPTIPVVEFAVAIAASPTPRSTVAAVPRITPPHSLPFTTGPPRA